MTDCGWFFNCWEWPLWTGVTWHVKSTAPCQFCSAQMPQQDNQTNTHSTVTWKADMKTICLCACLCTNALTHTHTHINKSGNIQTCICVFAQIQTSTVTRCEVYYLGLKLSQPTWTCDTQCCTTLQKRLTIFKYCTETLYTQKRVREVTPIFFIIYIYIYILKVIWTYCTVTCTASLHKYINIDVN